MVANETQVAMGLKGTGEALLSQMYSGLVQTIGSIFHISLAHAGFFLIAVILLLTWWKYDFYYKYIRWAMFIIASLLMLMAFSVI